MSSRQQGNAINQREEQENVAPSAGSTTGGAPHPRGASEATQPLQESASKEEATRGPIGRSVTEMWALLQSGKPVVDEVRPGNVAAKPFALGIAAKALR